MAKIFDQEINKHTDWGGDATTGNAPVAGGRVQEFIKEQLEKRMGCLYYDSANTRYLAFADEENRDLYLENPVQNNTLLLGTFIAPSEYSASITLLTPVTSTIFAGQKNIFAEFSFSITNKSGADTGESVLCNYTIINGNDKKTITIRYKYNEQVRFKLDDFLKVGSNRVTINIIGETSLAGTSVGLTVNQIELSLSHSFDVSKNHASTDTISIPYVIAGAGVKKLEWYLDGQKLPEESNDIITQTTTSRVKNIQYTLLAHGTHSLQFRGYIEVDSVKFYTKTHYIGFIVVNQSLASVIGYSCELSGDNIIAGGNTCTVSGVLQYEPFNIRYAVYSPKGVVSNVTLYSDNIPINQSVVSNGTQVAYQFRSAKYGIVSFKIGVEDKFEVITFEINKSPYSIEEITNGLTLALSAAGRTNLDKEKNKWIYENIETTFTNFTWDALSGWNNNKLHIKRGSYIDIDFRPFQSDIRKTGITLELTFFTADTIDESATILSCQKGEKGLKITGEDMSLVSDGGKKISVFYKKREQIRVSFVVHKDTGDNFQQMAFIYINGSFAKMVSYDRTDNFLNDSKIRIGDSTGNTDVVLSNIRAYNRPLSPEEIMNNHILYQDNVDSMLSIYDKNDITELGTNTLSVDKISATCPVLIMTGDVTTLLETKDKNTTIHLEDIEFINLQNPSLEFKGQGLRVKPQGTSSMQYPIKNFRLYYKYGKIYNNKGELITAVQIQNKSIPVSVVCLKADYAESSGTHNTGIARLWNDALYNVQLDGQYVCRTNAQKKALESGYTQDVRTAIDGYPIVVFYRTSINAPLNFLGHYNFNNDKSTEQVFGFRDIPGFDNTHVACWEHLNNTHPIGLFTNISSFDTDWEQAFEARYPEDYSPHHLQSLKNFATWVNSTANNPAKFRAEKSQHLHLHLMAAYYVYLMRHGAVDQVVKNAMLTTEDGFHYYFILYDNDTINGGRNDGLWVYPPTIDRQTRDTDFTSETYCYAGYDSVLWNNLEADPEFMELVRQMDRALYMTGINYRNVIDIFDNKQMGKWCERIYNEDHKIKYIQPFQDKGINNLFMAQGARQQHRRYWLSNRFALYDAKFVSGEYKSNVIDLKFAGGNGSFTITSGKHTHYGYGINNDVIESGHELQRGQSVTFTTPRVLAIGDPLRIYTAHTVKGIDISNLQTSLAQININSVNHSEMGSMFEDLIMGTAVGTNTSLTEISGLSEAYALKKLDIRGFKSLTSLNLSNQNLFTELLANNSGISSIQLAKSAPVTKLELPKINSLILDSLPLLTNAGLIIEDSGLSTDEVVIKYCPQFDSKTWVLAWINQKAEPRRQLTLEGIKWNMTYAELQTLKAKIATINIIGEIIITDQFTQEMVDWITINFGDTVFTAGSAFVINGTDGAYIFGANQVKINHPEKYTAAIFPIISNQIIFYSITYPTYAQIDNDGVASIIKDFDGTMQAAINIRSNLTPDVILASKIVTLVGYTYPTSATIVPPETIPLGKTSIQLETEDFSGNVRYEWSLVSLDPSIAILENTENRNCVINVLSIADGALYTNISCKVYKQGEQTPLFTVTKEILIADINFLANQRTNPFLCNMMFSNGYSESNQLVTKIDALKVVGMFPEKLEKFTTFNEFKYFSNVTSVPVGSGSGGPLKSITFPNSIETISLRCFSGCRNLTSVILSDSIKTIGSESFLRCTALKELRLPAKVATIGISTGLPALNINITVDPNNNTLSSYQGWLYNKQKTELISATSNLAQIPNSVTAIRQYAFEDFRLSTITLPSSLQKIGLGAFLDSRITSLDIPNSVTEIGSLAFKNSTISSIVLPNGLVGTLSDSMFESCSLQSIVIPEGITIIGYRCFYGCRLESVTFPSSVTEIGQYCFTSSYALTNVVLSDNLTTIGEYAFQSCTNLTSINLPTSLISIKGYAFANTTNLNIDLVFPNKVTQIGLKAFSKSGIRSVVIPSTVNSVESDAFEYCGNLTTTVVNAIPSMGTNCFGSCSALTNVTLAEGITVLPALTFYSCTSLKTITIPASVRTIGNAFIYCKALSTIYMLNLNPSSMSIDSRAFGADVSSYTGRDSYSAGTNRLYVPANATGYDQGVWLDPLCDNTKCGFTLSKTL